MDHEEKQETAGTEQEAETVEVDAADENAASVDGADEAETAEVEAADEVAAPVDVAEETEAVEADTAEVAAPVDAAEETETVEADAVEVDTATVDAAEETEAVEADAVEVDTATVDAAETVEADTADTDAPAEAEASPPPSPPLRLEDIDFDNIEDMTAIYEMTIKNFEEGEVVKGRIVSIGAETVLVDIGFKSEGTISLSEFSDPDSMVVDGEVDVLIEMVEDQDGMIVLSKTKADKIKNWAKIQERFENEELVEGKIVRQVKGGFKVDIGLDAFLPASQIARRPVGDLGQYLGQSFEFRIIKLTKRRRNVVLSRKQVLEEARSEDKAKLLASLEIGQELSGVIKNITDFGAFIDVGGIDGLLHITDMSWGRIKHPSEVSSVGDNLTVKVLNFNKEEEKISLGLKQMSPNPWSNVQDTYPLGAVVRGKVVSMTDYGAFVQLEEGVEGMVHISEMSWTKRVRHPSEIVHIGQEIDIKLLNVDAAHEKISLGLKQIGDNPWLKMKDKYPSGSIVPGLVRNLTDYGAFIQIEEGIDGLLHISDMSWTKKISHPSEVLKKGDEIEVQILNIDADHEKISLGIKQLESDPWRDVGDKYHVGDKVEATISKLVSFGAFARLDNGIEGLIHISELSKDRVNKPEEVVQPGATVTVKIISTDPATRKIGLSLKQYKDDVEKGDISQYSYKAQESKGGTSFGELAGLTISPESGALVIEKPNGGAKPEEPKAEEPKAEEAKAEEPKAEEAAPEAAAEETPAEAAVEETVAEAAPEAAAEEAPAEAAVEETVAEAAPEAAAEETPAEAAVEETVAEAAPEAAVEEAPAEEAPAEAAAEEVAAEAAVEEPVAEAAAEEAPAEAVTEEPVAEAAAEEAPAEAPTDEPVAEEEQDKVDQ
jgi:small subunit ribosomal protein S1